MCTRMSAVEESSSALDHLARIHRRVIDGADLLLLVRDEMIALVEKQDAEFLPLAVGHDGAAIIEHVRPR